MTDFKSAGFCLLSETGLKENATQGGLVGLMILSHWCSEITKMYGAIEGWILLLAFTDKVLI